MRFKIDRASLIAGSKFTVLLCFTLYLGAIFQVQAPGGLIFGGAYFRNFTVSVFVYRSLQSDESIEM